MNDLDEFRPDECPSCSMALDSLSDDDLCYRCAVALNHVSAAIFTWDESLCCAADDFACCAEDDCACCLEDDFAYVM